MMLDTPSIKLEDFAVSPQNGFLPTNPPVTRLSDEYYGPWEIIAANLPTLIKIGGIRESVNELPVLTTDKLLSEEEWRRAYSVLGFMTHAYIWGGQHPKDVSSRSMPFVPSAVSNEKCLLHADHPALHYQALPGNLQPPRAPTLCHLCHPGPLELHREPRYRHHRPQQCKDFHLFHWRSRRGVVLRCLRRSRGQGREAPNPNARCFCCRNCQKRRTRDCTTLQLHRSTHRLQQDPQAHV